MSKKRHWRDFLKKEFLHGSELEGEVTVTIKSFDEIEVFSRKEREMEELGVMHFEENLKPMILTSRKCEAMEALFGSVYIDDWIGQKVTLYAKDEKHFGKVHPVITVKSKTNATKASSKKAMIPGGPKWDEAVKSIANKTATVDGIKKYYSLTSEAEAELKKQANDLQAKSK